MFGYITVGTNDLGAAKAFYDALLVEVGANCFYADDHMAIYGETTTSPSLMVTRPYDGEAASVGNGMMVALQVGGPDVVDRVHHKALALGGVCEGKPGPRGSGDVYAGYFRDLDGNKFNAFFSKRRAAADV